MKCKWLVVANAARARVLEQTDEAGVFEPVADLVHPQSRMKGERLGSDRPGHAHAEGRGMAGTSYPPRTDPREREHDRFAREVAAAVNDGVAQDRCAGITLVASDPFLGQLKSHLGSQARKLLLRTIAADYTTLRDDELARRIAATS
jgi:protein required for attachment to host cells